MSDTCAVDSGVEYVRVGGGGHTAYQMFGGGNHLIMFRPELLTHLEVQWEEPAFARNLERLGSFARVITLDHRGVGLADPVDFGNFDIAEWVDDMAAVIEHIGEGPASVITSGSASMMAISPGNV